MSTPLGEQVNSWLRSLPSNEANADELEFLRLSYKQRIMLFITLLGLGVFFAFMSTFMLLSPRRFAKFYTIGTMLILSSSLVLVGPKKQLASMCHPSRAISAAIYGASVIITLYCAISLRSAGLSLIAIIIQFAAALWYGASYIPFAQRCLRKAAGAILPL